MENGEPAFRLSELGAGALFRLDYADGTQFWFTSSGDNLWAHWPETSSLDDAATYLLGPVLGILLRILGVVSLHASAVSWEGRAVTFIGPPGAGKSTTAAILAQQGCAVLSDDIVALQERGGRLHVLPAYPFLCLWPASARLLYGSADSLPRLTPSWDKRCLAVGNRNLKFEWQPVPLAAIYALSERVPGPGPFVEPQSAFASLTALLANSYATNILTGERRAEEFRFLGSLASRTGVQSVHVPQNRAHYREFFRSIVGGL